MVGGVGALGGSDEVLCGVEVGGFAGAWGANFGGALLARECELEGEVWICEGEGGGEGGGCGGVRPRSLRAKCCALCARSLGSLLELSYNYSFPFFSFLCARSARNFFPLHPISFTF